MIQHCHEALAINRHFHGPDFFLTMTADPNWPEINSYAYTIQSLNTALLSCLLWTLGIVIHLYTQYT